MESQNDSGNARHPTLFNCFYRGPEASIKNIQQSITSPTDTTEALTYAVGYIDQGATVSQACQQDYKILEKRYQAATDTISSDQKVLEQLKTQAEEQSSRVENLEDDLTTQKRLNDRLQRKITKLQTGQTVDLESLELMEVRAKLQTATDRKEEYKGKYFALEKRFADTKSKLKGEEEKNCEFKAENMRLETAVVAQSQELTIEKKKYAQVSAEFVEAKHHLDVDGHIIAGIQQERELLKKTVDEKTREIELVKKKCAEPRKLLQAKLDETLSRLEIVEDEHEPCKAGFQAVEVAPSTAAAKSEEAKENVVLKNAVTIAGNIDIEGAPSKVDDEFFPLPPLPFDVTIYGYSSRKLFVTDNGMICFDQTIESPVGKKDARELPHYDLVPPYTIFPFWTDLMIAKGEPHGIFFEVAGERGSRTVTVEWYVTHYEHKANYYHFTVQLEEARPNIVTFKYYDAVDKGETCTIGVQGKNSFKMYSHKKQTVFPGLQLVFDTRANTVEQGRFK